MKLSAGGESFRKEYIWQSLTDWKTWVASAPLFIFKLVNDSANI